MTSKHETIIQEQADRLIRTHQEVNSYLDDLILQRNNLEFELEISIRMSHESQTVYLRHKIEPIVSMIDSLNRIILTLKWEK